MMREIIANVLCPFIGTVGFAVLYNVPKRYFISCGMTGMAGWLVYLFVAKFTILSSAVASFFGTVVVVLISRMLTVRLKCPVTVFLVSGIFPLVPGAGVYYTAYYLVMEQLNLAAERGLEAFKIAFGIVLGIAVVLAVPREFFQPGSWRQRKYRIRRQEKRK